MSNRPSSRIRSLLLRLQDLETTAVSRGHLDDAREYRHAHLIVERIQRGATTPDPFIATFPQVYQRTWKAHLEMRARIDAQLMQQLADLPAEVYLSPIDGRTPDQWVQSVLAYLAWRAGASWRHWKELHCQWDAYAAAAHLLRQAQSTSQVHRVKAIAESGGPDVGSAQGGLISPALVTNSLPPKKPPTSTTGAWHDDSTCISQRSSDQRQIS